MLILHIDINVFNIWINGDIFIKTRKLYLLTPLEASSAGNHPSTSNRQSLFLKHYISDINLSKLRCLWQLKFVHVQQGNLILKIIFIRSRKQY